MHFDGLVPLVYFLVGTYAIIATSQSIAPIIMRRVEIKAPKLKCFSLIVDQVLMTHNPTSELGKILLRQDADADVTLLTATCLG